jgi:homoserine dehydrogenase
MMQRAGDNSGGTVPMIFIVYDIDQSILNTALNVLLTNGSVQSVDNVLRVLKNN